MTHQTSTALVVLKPGPTPPGSEARAGETPPDPTTVDLVRGWFQRRGFELGPFVGISFAITGSEALFHEHLGAAAHIDQAGDEMAFGLSSLDEEIRLRVDAVVVPAAPDFGPGNP